MTKCTFPGCNVQVTTPGHKLCYDHWKASRDQPRAAAPTSAPAPQSAVVPKTPPPVMPPKTPAPAEISKAPQSAPAAAPQPRPPTPPAAPADGQLLSATVIGEKLGFTSQRINQILAELGWINREKKGWVATAQGLALGAVQKEAYQTGIPYVAWPATLTANKALTATIKSAKGEETPVATVVAPMARPSARPSVRRRLRREFLLLWHS